MDYETHMNEVIKIFDLKNWTVIWVPDKTQPRGQIQPETRVILIHDDKAEDALETLLHEVLEIKLRPMLKPYRDLVNSLVGWADKQVYYSKEEIINDLTPFLLKFVEDTPELQEKG